MLSRALTISAACEKFAPHATLTRRPYLCRRLDGIPLAIELAAARMRVLPLEQILAKMSDRFRLLTSGGRTADARQQTLRATLDDGCAVVGGNDE
jgi:predicted ATPase